MRSFDDGIAFQYGDQKINADSDPYLGFDGVGGCAVKGFDSQMLLDPAEEELHLPALLVNIGDGYGRNGKDIGQVDKTLPGKGGTAPDFSCRA